MENKINEVENVEIDLVKNYLKSQSFEKKFVDFMTKMLDKYGLAIFNLNGIGEQLDISKSIKKMATSETMADTSVDPNSNTNIITPGAMLTEIAKPHLLIHNHHRVWKFFKKEKGIEYANDLLERKISGQFYIHDFSSFLPYCFNFDPIHIALLGIPKELDGKGESLPPQNLESFFGQLQDILPIFAKNLAGACGIATLFLVLSIFMKKTLMDNKIDKTELKSEEEVWKYLKTKLTSLLYNLNRPSRDGMQSLFTNVSIMSPSFLEELCPNMTIPFKDGQVITADVDLTLKIQELWVDMFNEESKRRLFTFPVQTLSIATEIKDGDKKPTIKDIEFFNKMMEKNIFLAAQNVYAGDSSTLSSCCFDGNQKILTKSTNGVKLCTFKEILEGTWDDYRKNFTIFHNGSWCSCKVIKLPKETHQMYKIITSNNKEIIVTDNHINVTLKGDKETTNLTTSDYLAFNTRTLDSYPEADRHLTYEQGVFIGAYLGDGSRYKRPTCESYETTLSLSESKLHLLDTINKALKDWNITKEFHVYESKHNVKSVKIYDVNIYNIIGEYVIGKYAYNKSIAPVVFTQSKEFRKGILDGWCATDGGNNNCVYSTSKDLIESMEALCTTLGINTTITVDTRKEHGMIREEKVVPNYSVYCLRWYTPCNKRSMDENFKVYNNTEYFKISSIESIETTDEEVYCVQMINEDEPYFTLPNGIITHNCRLRSDKTKIFTNSLGGSSSNIGSYGVVTVNLATLALRYKNDMDTFWKELDKNIIYAQEVNRAKMKFIKEDIDAGRLPMYTLGFVTLDRQYATLGINGLYECCVELGKDYRLDENREFIEELLKHINNVNDNYGDTVLNHMVNVEQVPAENVAVKLASIDKLQGLNDKYEIYANQFIPLTTETEGGIIERILIQGELDEYFSGGSILHINLDQECTDEETFINLGKLAIESGVRYFGINYQTNFCNSCKQSFVGKQDKCPHCQSEDFDRYCRVVGYLVAINNYNKARRKEYKNRIFYEELPSVTCC